MKLDKSCALLVIDIQQEDFTEMNESNMDEPRWTCIRNGKRVLDVFRAKKLPVIHIKECHRPDMVDFGRELDGSEGIHCIENRPENDYANLTYPLEGEYRITKRRYSAFFATDLEILLKGLGVDTLYLIGGLTDVCIHYTAVDAHQNDYHIRVVTDAAAGSNEKAHEAALQAIQYLQRDALITTADVESALADNTTPEDETFMREAIRLSKLAVEHGNEPFGAVLVKENKIVFSNENQIYTKHDPTFHGEAGLIREFCAQTAITDLHEYTLYSSCEPCFMCSGAMVWVKLGRLVYSASNIELENILGNKGCNCSKIVFDNSFWKPKVTEGILRDESLSILQKYFSKHTKG
ncbi:isochorismatase family protein [Frisingicoccus sp.]|uniref:isochorismatase family protein n=1 Tax=Frisingicoccus sp. TaxID=1918627 RepID=UPI003AB67229